MLHEKELVLNKQDTSNILGAVDVVRDLVSSITNLGSLKSFSFNNILKELLNTHKGAVFSLGLFVCASSYCQKKGSVACMSYRDLRVAPLVASVCIDVLAESVPTPWPRCELT